MILDNYTGLTLVSYPLNILIIFSFVITFIYVSLNNFFPLIKITSNSNIILIPFFFFIIYTSIVFIILLVDVLVARYYVIFTYLLLLVFSIYKFKNFKFFYKKKYNYFISKVKKIKNFELFILFSFFTLYFLISILPISDADSLNYHSGFASMVIKNNNLNFLRNTEIIDFNFFFVGYGEIINFIGLSLGLDNFGSVINFSSIVLIFLYLLQNYRKNVSFVAISIISSPILISLISSQKNYLLPITLLSILFLNIYKNNFRKQDLIIFSTIIYFVIASKTSMFIFAIFAILILGYISVRKNFFSYFLNISLILCFFILIPFIYKNIFFHLDILPPFTGELFNNNSKEASNFTNWIRSYGVTLSLQNLFYLPFLFLLPHYADSGKIIFSITQITKIFGLQFYNFLFVRGVSKYYIFLLLSIFFFILITKNISTRWFLLIFLLLQYSILEFKFNNYHFFKKIIYIQSFLVSVILLIFIIFSFFFLITGGKEKFYDRFSYGYSFSQKISNLINKHDLKDDEYILYSHRSQFWNDYSKNLINFGNDYNELYNYKNNEIYLNKKIIKKLSNKKIKIIIFKEHFNDITNININKNCRYIYEKFSENRQTRNIFLSGQKKYSYIYFIEDNLIKCFD